MQVVQLYIEGERVDLFKDESVTITQTIQNVKDIAKVFTDFTKTFSLPASKRNNKIFKHYYNYDIDGGYDARKKSTARLELNNKAFRKGKIKLDGVTLKNGKPNTYKITFFGNTVDLKDLLGEDTLSSLEWLDNFNNEYNATQVRTALTGGIDKTVDSVTYTNAIVAPLISHTTRLYYDSSITPNPYPDENSGNLYPSGSNMQGVYFGELKYAIPVHIIIKAIEQTYGITFSTNFFNSTNDPYYKLYMWLHRKKGDAFDEGEPVTTIVDSFPADSFPLTVTGVFCNGTNFQVFGMTFPTQLAYSLTVTTSTTDDYSIIIKKDGVIYRQENVNGGGTYNFTGYLTNSSTGYQVYLYTTTAITFTSVAMFVSNTTTGESKTYTTGSFSTTTTQNFIITEQIPKMKVIDFLTGLFKMFNLTAFYEDDTIVVKTLDSYYASSSITRDITKYVSVGDSNVDVALPFKEVDFGYEGLGTKLALQHQQANNLEWGTVEYQGDDNYDAGGEIYSVKAPFEHLKYERLIDGSGSSLTTAQVGWFVDDNNDPYFGKPLLFYPVLNSGTSIRFLNDTISSFQSISSYFIPSNSVSINSSTDDDNINFNLEVNEYTLDTTFDGTLFQNYYKTYIEEIFNNKLRLTKVKAYLPISFLLNYSLADKVQILDRVYKINSIESNLETGESNLELLNYIPVVPTETFNCSDAALVISDGCEGSTVTGSVSLGTIDSISPSTYTLGSNSYTATITVPSGYLNTGSTITCSDTATAVGNADCSTVSLSVSDGTTGDAVTASVSVGTIQSISPSTYLSGTNTYTAIVLIPSGYCNTGQTISCTDTATGTALVPSATILGPTSGTTGSNITLIGEDNNFTGSTWAWTGGSAQGLTTKSITFNESSAGSVTYGVTIDGTYSDTHTVTWSAPPPSPYVQILGVTSATTGSSITLTAEDYNFTGSTWAWTGGDAQGKTTKVITVSESSAGNETYGVTVDGTYTDSHTVTWSAPQPTIYYREYRNLASCPSTIEGAGLVRNISNTTNSFPTYIQIAQDSGECFYSYATGSSAGAIDLNSSNVTQFSNCTDCFTPVEYYQLEYCVTGSTSFRSSQTTSDISLSANDRVTDPGANNYYKVIGTTTNAGLSQVTVTDTGLSGCPTPCTQISNIYTSTTSAQDAYCTSTKAATVYFNDTNFGSATKVYTDSNCTTLRTVDTWYSDQISVTRFWDASAQTLTTVSNPSCP